MPARPATDGHPRSVVLAHGRSRVVHAYAGTGEPTPLCYAAGGPWAYSDARANCGHCRRRTVSPWHPSNRKGLA